MRGTAGVSTSNHHQLLAFSVYSTVSTRYSSQNSNSSISCINTTCRGCKNVTQCRPCSHVSNPSEPAPTLSLSSFSPPSRNLFLLLSSFLPLFYLSLSSALTVLRSASRLFIASVYCWTLCTLPAENKAAARTGQ